MPQTYSPMPYNMPIRKCFETGNKVATGCPVGMKRCEYTTSSGFIWYKACVTTEAICIWAGDICPMTDF